MVEIVMKYSIGETLNTEGYGEVKVVEIYLSTYVKGAIVYELNDGRSNYLVEEQELSEQIIQE